MDSQVVNHHDLILKGINPEDNTVSELFLEGISTATGTNLKMVQALAKDLGASVTKKDPTENLKEENTDKLTYEQDVVLCHIARSPEVYGQEQAKRAMNILFNTYKKIATYASVKTGIAGLDFEVQSIVERDDIHSIANLALCEVVLSGYKIASGYKLSTIIDRSCCLKILQEQRDGKFKDYHGMTRKEQDIIKYVGKHPEDRNDYAKIAKATKASAAFVKEVLRLTNGEWICNNSLNALEERSESGKDGPNNGGGDGTVEATRFSNEDWKIAKEDTENNVVDDLTDSEMRRLVAKGLQFLTDLERRIFTQIAYKTETKKGVAADEGITVAKVNSIYWEAQGKMKVWMEMHGYTKTIYEAISL